MAPNLLWFENNGARNDTKNFFYGGDAARESRPFSWSSLDLKYFSGKFGKFREKFLSIPKNLPAPIPMPHPKTTSPQQCYFLPSAKALQRFAWKSNFLTVYTLVSLNYMLSVSEYVTTNVTAKPVTFLHGTNHGCTVVCHMCSCNTLTVTRK